MPNEIALHAQRVAAAVESSDAARSVIVASWRRCSHSYGLDPSGHAPRRRLSAVELRESTQRLEPLVYAAGPTLDRLQALVPSMNCCVLMAGLDGVLVHWRGKDVDVDVVRRLGLWSGVDWSEKNEGTNGVGTCLVEKRALTIHQGEHFLARDSELSCSVAPIFDHEGRLAAALDITHYGNAASEGLIGLLAFTVREAAWQIEAANFRNVFCNARIVTVPDRTRACVGLIAVDQDDMVLGATRAARLLLGIGDGDLRSGIPAMDLQKGGADLDDSMVHAERGTIRRALARAGGNVSASARALDISRATMKRKLKKFNLHKQA
jgi:transcriptional regulator of acetoin/glycerol metabolism